MVENGGLLQHAPPPRRGNRAVETVETWTSRGHEKEKRENNGRRVSRVGEGGETEKEEMEESGSCQDQE